MKTLNVISVAFVVCAALVIASCGSGQLGGACGHYQDWEKAEDDAYDIERRNRGRNPGEWRSGDLERWEKALDRSLAASRRFVAALPEGKTWSDAERECR